MHIFNDFWMFSLEWVVFLCFTTNPKLLFFITFFHLFISISIQLLFDFFYKHFLKNAVVMHYLLLERWIFFTEISLLQYTIYQHKNDNLSRWSWHKQVFFFYITLLIFTYFKTVCLISNCILSQSNFYFFLYHS